MTDTRDINERSHFFECACYSDEHTMRFIFDDDKDWPEVFASMHLANGGFWYRLTRAVKYLFGYKCKYGQWDCWILRPQDARCLRDLINEYLSRIEHEFPYQ